MVKLARKTVRPDNEESIGYTTMTLHTHESDNADMTMKGNYENQSESDTVKTNTDNDRVLHYTIQDHVIVPCHESEDSVKDKTEYDIDIYDCVNDTDYIDHEEVIDERYELDNDNVQLQFHKSEDTDNDKQKKHASYNSDSNDDSARDADFEDDEEVGDHTYELEHKKPKKSQLNFHQSVDIHKDKQNEHATYNSESDTTIDLDDSVRDPDYVEEAEVVDERDELFEFEHKKPKKNQLNCHQSVDTHQNKQKEHGTYNSDSLIEEESDTTIDLDDSVRDPDYVEEAEVVDKRDELFEFEHKEPKKRKVKHDKSNYEKNINKRLRMEGKSYKGMEKRDGSWKYCAERNGRILTPKGCSKRCDRSKVLECTKFSEEDRQDIFTKFWANLNWDERKVYVISLVKLVPIAKKIDGPGRRGVTYKYYLKKNDTLHIVCKHMFLSTLGIGERTIYEWLKDTDHGIPEKPERKTRDPSEGHRKAREYAEKYLESLPKLPSHYCRSSSSKLYLEPVFESFSVLYSEYKKYCTEHDQPVVCYTVFTSMFKDMNLSLFSPKKDQCDLCCGYEAGNVSVEDYNKHIEKKDAARNAKTKDKEKCENDDTGACVVITMDVQSVLLSPRLQASAMYYKTKLACHNFTVYDLKSKEVTCYFWHEGEGDLTSDSFSSCITDYIETLTEDQNVKEIIIYSDGCCYQNRNVGLSNTLLKLAVDKHVTITQKYLEKGHTQMEVDSAHSVIERKLKKKPIYVPYNYVEVMSQARPSQPYKVKYITHEFFGKYSDLQYYSSIRPGVRVGDPVVTDIRVLSYNQGGDIMYSCLHGDELQEFPRKAKKQAVEPGQTVERRHAGPLSIKNSKFAHLQQLKAVIPKDFHAFYDSLLHA
ncbi:MAG: hypothetical protein ABW168_20530 [Sedimenticola sp.]